MKRSNRRTLFRLLVTMLCLVLLLAIGPSAQALQLKRQDLVVKAPVVQALPETKIVVSPKVEAQPKLRPDIKVDLKPQQLLPDIREKLKVRPDIRIDREKLLNPITLWGKPTGNTMHAKVMGPIGTAIPIYRDCTILNLGGPIGWIPVGEFITVEIYTMGFGKLIAYDMEGFVMLSSLMEDVDENSFPEGEGYLALVNAPGGAVNVMQYWYLDKMGDKSIGRLKYEEMVVAQNYDNGYSTEIWHSSGLHGFVRTDQLTYWEELNVEP